MIHPNDRQAKAIEAAAANCVVIAGPGTGKSKVLLWRALYLCTQRGVQPYDIALVSFTNASVNDLKQTITRSEYSKLKDIRLTTFHSLALRALLRSGLTRGSIFIADDWEESSLIDGYLKRALGLGRIDQAEKRRRAYEARWCRATTDPDEWITSEERQEFHRAFSAAKNAFDFTTRGELTYRWWLQLTSEPDASNHDMGVDFKYVLADEYQDLNECEHEILQALGTRGVGVFAVGDPNQSIYGGMRHAHPEQCVSFPERFTSAQLVVLDETYRCCSRVLDAAAALMRGVPGAEGVPNVSHQAERGCFRPINFIDQDAEASGVASAVRTLISVTPDKTILVVVPNKQVGKIVGNLLTQFDVEHTLALRKKRTLEEDKKRRARAFARLLGNPMDSMAAATAILLSGIKAHRPEELSGIVKLCETAHKKACQLLAEPSDDGPQPLRTAIEKAQARLTELRALSTEDAIALLEKESGAEALANYLLPRQQLHHLQNLAASGETAHDEGEAEETLVANERVRVTTYHSSKGLEADVVFAMSVEPTFFEEDGRSDVEEMRRLLFVGMTRARSAAYTTYASRRFGTSHYVADVSTNRRGPSAFLAEVREELGIEALGGTDFIGQLRASGCCD